MEPNELYTQSDSARATTKLIGREDQLAQIDRAVREAQGTWIVQISGQGGIGKTRLVSEVLHRYQDSPGVLAARAPVDLYHTRTHSIEGLMAAICAAQDPEAKGFAAYREAQHALDRYLVEPSGQAEKRLALRRDVQKAFLDDMNKLAAGRRLLLVLDTAEKLVYEITAVERRLGLTQERLATWGWLRDEFLPNATNGVVILAGRLQVAQLTEDLPLLQGVNCLPIRLPPFTSDEALAYFEAVAEDAERQGSLHVAERICSLPEDWRRAIAEKTSGRPILLALTIDYLVTAPALPHDLPLLDEAALVKELMRVNQETRRPTGAALRALAWARKGMDAELLARVAECKTPDGGWDLAWAQSALEQLKGLSFVKIRPSDQRVFLHDEMYDLLERHVLQPADWPAGAERAYRSIGAYYREKIEEYRDRLAEAYQSLSRTGAAEVPQHINQISERLQEALVEDLHYRLRADAPRGFDVYYRYAEEAALWENASLDAELRAELLGFLDERDPSGQLPEVEDLPRSAVEADGAIRWVKRRIAAEEYAAALALVTDVQQQGVLRAEDKLSSAELTVWDVLAQLYGGLTPSEQVANNLKPVVVSLEEQPRSWRRDAVLARAYNNLGYALRVDGRYEGAVRTYMKALPLWRWVKIVAEQANTLNNVAFARAEIGDFAPARRWAMDAFGLRQKSGARPQIGLSLSTLAQIAIREGLFITARRYAEQAVALFRATLNVRGLGLALTALAEAKRRFGAEGPCPDTEASQLLEEAVSHAQEARDVFARAVEPSRKIEAFIELGCGYRDWMKLRRRYESDSDAVENLAGYSRDALKEAEQLADKHNLLHLRLDALINEAWLEYYLEAYYRWMAKPLDFVAGQQAGECAEVLLGRAENLIPAYYLVTTSYGVPPLDPERLVVPILSRIGKLQLLRGQRAFNEFEERHQADDLSRSIECYTLSLAYDNLVSRAPFRDRRRAQDRIYERMKKLNPSEWRMVYQAVRQTELNYRLGRSEMRRFLEDNFGLEEDISAVGYDPSVL